MTSAQRTILIYRYDPAKGGDGYFDRFELDIPAPETTTILDVLIRILKEQDQSLAFRYACRVNMCGSCGLVINGQEGLACKTNVSHLPAKQDITIRPLNHFPIIKDLVVDMSPFFEKYEDALPFFEPGDQRDEPWLIKPDNPKRVSIGMSTDCIACGCCVSSCTMVNHHEGYAGPAALNRAFTLLADERDGLFVPRLTRALDSCYNCRTEFNCTEVCPKQISGTRAIKYIQRLALKHLDALKPLEAHPAEQRPASPQKPDEACSCGHESQAAEQKPASPPTPVEACACGSEKSIKITSIPHPQPPKVEPSCCADRRKLIMGLVGFGSLAVLGSIMGVAAVGPSNEKSPVQWVAVGKVAELAVGKISTLRLAYTRTRAFHKEFVNSTVLVRQDKAGEFICFSSACPHLGCQVDWDSALKRFKCACHGGAFDLDGKVVAGPPPSPLPRLPWRIENDTLMVEVV